MPSTIRIKRSGVLGKVPTTSDIGQGELAINFKDQKLYSSNGTAVFQITGGGSSSNGFSGILVGANVIVADSSTDRLTLTAGSRINLAGNPTTDTITISASTNDYLQVANAASVYQTKAVERAALANTNASIATQATRVTLVNTNLTGTNTALRTLISDRLQVANASTLYATKSNPTTSGLLAHTGRQTISTNLTVSGNTTSARYILTNTNGISAVGDSSGWRFDGAGYVYFNQSGLTYSQTRIVARAGISDDTNQTLTLYGGINGSTTINGLLAAAGRATIGTNLTVSGNTTLNGTTTDNSNALSQTLTDATTIAWNTASGRVATVTLAASRIMGAPTNLKIGTYILNVIQGGTGSYTITWNAVFKWPAGVAPSLSTAVGARDLFTFYSDGTNLYGSYLPDVK